MATVMGEYSGVPTEAAYHCIRLRSRNSPGVGVRGGMSLPAHSVPMTTTPRSPAATRGVVALLQGAGDRDPAAFVP
jgi:hypothetical protein